MRDEAKGIKRLTLSAPVSPLKPGDVDENGNEVETSKGSQVFFRSPQILELSKPMTPDEYDKKRKELEAKYPGI